MLHVFEVILAGGTDPNEVLSDEVKLETQAQIMTESEAEAVGFRGVQPAPDGRTRCFIAVAARDSRWVQNRLEMHRGVDGFQMHTVETEE